MTKSPLATAILFLFAGCSGSQGASNGAGGGDTGKAGKGGAGGALGAGGRGAGGGGGSGTAAGGSNGLGGSAGPGGAPAGGGGFTVASGGAGGAAVASGGAGGSAVASGGAGGFTVASGGAGGAAVPSGGAGGSAVASGGAGGSAVVHDRCADPQRVEFANGRITISDDTSRATDEFPTLACGGGHFVAGLRGRQLYYRFTVRAGLKYELRLQSINHNYDPDIFYVFPAVSTCTVDAIQAACTSGGQIGTASTWPNPGELITFVPRDPGDYIVAVDADSAGKGGPFALDIFEFCGPSSSTGCRAEACTPSLAGTCAGNVLTICADGTGYAMDDCAVSGSTCFKGVCQPTVVDSIGSLGRTITPTTTATDTSAFNFYAVSTKRTLTQIDQLQYQGSAIPLTWLVFEATAQAGPYLPILSKKTISNSAASGASESSGAIAVPLLAGRYYAIGVAVPTGATLDLGKEMMSPLLPEATFFGQLVSATTLIGPPSWPSIVYATPTTFVFPQRLTTTL